MPLGSYTCALSLEGSLAGDRAVAAAVTALADQSDVLTLALWPLGHGAIATECLGHWQETSVIDLRDGAEAAIARFKGVTRRMAGQAARRGVKCAVSKPEEGIDLYYAMLCGSARRGGLAAPSISRARLGAVVRAAGGDAELWFARLDGEPIAGGVVLYGSEELFFWSAAMREEFSYLRPSNALNVALIKTAAERGLRWYNWGASVGLPGVALFKRSLGAERLGYRSYTFHSRRYALFRRLKNVLLGRDDAPAAQSNPMNAVIGSSVDGGAGPSGPATPPSMTPAPESRSVLR